LFLQSLPHGGLQGRKAEAVMFVAPDHEVHAGIAEIAYPVEQYDGLFH
jgi:hypothetical protein